MNKLSRFEIVLVLVWLPMVSTPSKQGLAMTYYYPQDLNKVSWFYNYTPGPFADDRWIPMAVDGFITTLPYNYDGWLMVFNEPDGPTHALSPQDAVIRYNNLRQAYPFAKFEVGNVTQDGLDWLSDFAELCNCTPYAWGMHGYSNQSNTPAYIENLWKSAHDELGGSFWITEWADTGGNVANDEQLKQWLNATLWVERWAYFTNRAYGNESWWPPNWVNQLWHMDGTPTEVGLWWTQ